MGTSETVRVRQRWNGSESAEIQADALQALRVRSEPGGVCGAFPRGFLYGRIWCDLIPAGALGHVCAGADRPHELEVCILPADNPPALMQRLRARART
ncbi:MAG: hypothetical protein JSR36_17765 [Proteobacteria bacterium]|nr:hypothetical protein [Pseudomonadota bacterium]